jgi:ABC-type multidrug transport system ATPase subunit
MAEAANRTPAYARAMDTLHVVETNGLTKRFGEATVVSDVDLRVPRGTAFGYLGPNGAGKTTLIRMLLGLTSPSAGTMTLLGLPLPAGRREALARVGSIVDEPRFHRHMTGRQNLWALAAARARRMHESRLRSNGSGFLTAPTTESPPTRWECASGSESLPA